MAPDADNPTLLQVLVLERVDRAKNMARFYVLSIEPTLFEDLALVRRWGRIGSAGRERIGLHPSRRVAQIELKKWLDRKTRRGYQLRGLEQAPGQEEGRADPVSRYRQVSLRNRPCECAPGRSTRSDPGSSP
jgi:predicted DNA-binding WGR domain protein